MYFLLLFFFLFQSTQSHRKNEYRAINPIVEYLWNPKTRSIPSDRHVASIVFHHPPPRNPRTQLGFQFERVRQTRGPSASHERQAIWRSSNVYLYPDPWKLSCRSPPLSILVPLCPGLLGRSFGRHFDRECLHRTVRYPPCKFVNFRT